MATGFWKGLFRPRKQCGAEMKLGVQVFRGLKCQLPEGHEGRHQMNAMTSWPRKREEPKGLQQPGGPEDL